MGMKEGEWIKGEVSGIEVEGYWTGRGILVQIIDSEKEYFLVPLVMWDQSTKMAEARMIGKHFIQIGGEYLLDGDALPVSRWGNQQKEE